MLPATRIGASRSGFIVAFGPGNAAGAADPARAARALARKYRFKVDRVYTHALKGFFSAGLTRDAVVAMQGAEKSGCRGA